MTRELVRDFCAEALATAEQKKKTERGQAGPSETLDPSVPKVHLEDRWPVMDDAAYYGVVGDIIRTIAPHTEADPVAILDSDLVVSSAISSAIPRTIKSKQTAIIQICTRCWSA